MVKLATKFEVLQDYFINGKGIREIARETTLSKNTVKRYIREYEGQKVEIINGGDKSEILLAMNEKPSYNAENRVKTVASDEVIDIINACLLENEHKRSIGKAKLCMKGTDIHELLLQEKFEISYQSVTGYIREIRKRKKEAFIKQYYEFGEVCEFDWGDAKLTIGGKEILFKMAVFTLACSNIRYALLYRHEDTQAFVDSHIKFFAFLGKVPHQMVYDNMRVAVAKFVGKTEKTATIALKQMSTYYGFDFRFCNICKGNEKGHVEKSVEFIRRKAYSSVGAFDTISDAAIRLIETVDRLNADKIELLEQEQLAMLDKVPDYSSVIRLTGKVDKFSTICCKQNHYSVPDYLVDKDVDVFVFTDEILIKYNGTEVAKQKRSYENGEYVLDILHYRETLMRKPGAIKNSLCLKQSCELLQIIFDKFFTDRPREFILMLDLLNDFTLPQLRISIETLLSTGVKIQIDSIKMILNHNNTVYEPTGCDEIERACEAQLARYALCDSMNHNTIGEVVA